MAEPIRQFNLNDPNDILYILEHLSNSNPDVGKGYDAASGLPYKGKYQIQNAAKNLDPLIYHILSQQYANYAANMPAYLNSLTNSLALATNPEARVGRQNAGVDAQKGGTLQSVLARLRNNGAGIGAEEGARSNIENQANAQKNLNRSNAYSPEGMMAMNDVLSAIMEKMNPDWRNAQAAHEIQLNTPRGKSGLEAAGGIITGLASSYLSGGMPGMGGGGPVHVPAGVQNLGNVKWTW